MKKNLTLITILVLLSPFVKGQAHAPMTNALRVGAEYMSLDAPDAMSYRFGGGYGLYLNRLKLQAEVGFLTFQGQDQWINGIPFEGQKRQRIMADLTFSFDFLKNKRHGLFVGLGPSLWYREDDSFSGATFGSDPTGQIVIVNQQRKQIRQFNLGYHFMAEYEYLVSPRIIISGRFGFADLNIAGSSSMAGFGLGYRL